LDEHFTEHTSEAAGEIAECSRYLRGSAFIARETIFADAFLRAATWTVVHLAGFHGKEQMLLIENDIWNDPEPGWLCAGRVVHQGGRRKKKARETGWCWRDVIRP